MIKCKHCGKELYQQGCPEDGGAKWKHEWNRAMNCDLYAEPDDGRDFKVMPSIWDELNDTMEGQWNPH